MKKILFAVFLLSASSLFGMETKTLSVLHIYSNILPEDEMVLITDYISSEVAAYDEFQIVSREHIKEVIEEQKFSLSGYADEAGLSGIGEILDSAFVLSGSLNMFGDTRRLLTLRMVEVESGKTVRLYSRLFEDSIGAVDDLDFFVDEFLSLAEFEEDVADYDMRYAFSKRPFTYENFTVSYMYSQMNFSTTNIEHDTVYLLYSNINGKTWGYFMNAYLGYPVVLKKDGTVETGYAINGLVGGATIGASYRFEINKSLFMAVGAGPSMNSYIFEGGFMALGAAADVSANILFKLDDFNQQGYYDYLIKKLGINDIFCRLGVTAGYYMLPLMDQLPAAIKTGTFTSGILISPYITISTIF